MNEIKQYFLSAPANLDSSMLPLIEKWDGENTTPIQILEVLDKCIYFGLASGFVVSVLQFLLDQALDKQNQKYEDVVKLATWRNSH